MQKASRHTSKGKSIAHNPRPEKGFPCLWSKPCSKSLGSTGTETKHMQVQGGGWACWEYVSEMCELPGKGSGKGNPMEEALVTFRPTGIWSGDQQPWGECPPQVPWREG